MNGTISKWTVNEARASNSPDNDNRCWILITILTSSCLPGLHLQESAPAGGWTVLMRETPEKKARKQVSGSC